MTKFCKACEKSFACEVKKCPDCGGKLEARYTEEEWAEIQKQNDDFTVINMIL